LTSRDPTRFSGTVSCLRIRPANDDVSLADWQHVHNAVVPTDALSLDEVRERVKRHHLAVGYLDDGTPVGCSTVRPPTGESATATVIARVLPPYRGRGFGEQLYASGLERARSLGCDTIETIVLESNVDGLRFARHHGFVEVESLLLPGDSIRWITLRLA
jgi:GNAT superfamily N-acetyltransferase